MLRLTFGQVKAMAAKQCGYNVTDPRVADVVNEGVERLLEMGKWVGTYGRFRICVNAACLTWPRELETIEAWAACSVPGIVRNQWYEFLGNGPGILDECGCSTDLVDQGEHCAFDDVRGTGKQLAVYSDVTEATGARIILEFFNNSNQFVRTQFGGDWINGESIALPAAGAYAYTVNECRAGGLVRVIKPKTNGYIRLYEYNTLTTALKPLGYYAPDEEIPVYRRSLVPGLSAESGGDCELSTVDVMAKLRFIPVELDNDMLLISSKPAIKLACKALMHEDANQYNEAAIAWGAAKRTLDEQLKHHMGDGAVQPVRTESSEIWGGGVQNIV